MSYHINSIHKNDCMLVTIDNMYYYLCILPLVPLHSLTVSLYRTVCPCVARWRSMCLSPFDVFSSETSRHECYQPFNVCKNKRTQQKRKEEKKKSDEIKCFIYICIRQYQCSMLDVCVDHMMWRIFLFFYTFTLRTDDWTCVDDFLFFFFFRFLFWN